MSKELVVKEMVIIPEENMKHLSLPTQKLIGELSDELDIDKLTKFNPLVETMIEIESFKSIKYDADDDVSIASFKEAKSTIRSFRSLTKKTKSLLKKPILETGKKLDKIEKTFVERATNVLNELEKEFKPYLDEEEKKKEERLAKKNKATTDKIEALSDEAVQQKKIIERGKLHTKLQNEISTYVPDAMTKAKTFSKNALAEEIEALKELKDTGYNLEEDEKAILLEEQQEEIATLFQNNIDAALHILQTEFDKPVVPVVPVIESGHNLGDTLTMGQISQPESSGMQMMAPSLTQANPDYFKTTVDTILSNSIVELNKLDPANDKEKSVKETLLKSFTSSKSKVIAYLDGE